MTRNEAKTLWIANFKAFDKLNRNIAKAQFADMQNNGARFDDFTGLLRMLRSQAEKARAAAMAASTEAALIIEASAEWKEAA
jgi:hypothetical protein